MNYVIFPLIQCAPLARVEQLVHANKLSLVEIVAIVPIAAGRDGDTVQKLDFFGRNPFPAIARKSERPDVRRSAKRGLPAPFRH